VALKVALTVTRVPTYNVVARLPAGAPEGQRLPGVVVIGAHYDHLGLGERHSLAPDSKRPHVGADDNASGTAALLEVARLLMERRAELRRDAVLVAFSGEEEGVLGSTEFTRSPPPPLAMREISAMVNMDMVGRLRDNRVTVLGRGSAEEWPALLEAACGTARIDCSGTSGSADGYGPSDQMPFYAAGIPVVHFFTGSHSDYHRPSDTPDKINAAGAGQIAAAVAALTLALADRAVPLTLKRIAAGAPGGGDMRSFGASLGTIPDYSGPPPGVTGVLLAGVRAGGAAEAAGLRRGDVLVRLGAHQLRSVEDLMFALGASKPGETVTAVVLRDGKEIKAPVTFQQGRPAK
jgi:Zn-dependent M28 family amino/carboxypeptidase